MATEYEQSAGLLDKITEVIEEFSEFAPIMDADLKFRAAFKSKFTGDGDDAEIEESYPYSDLKKVSPLMRAFLEEDYIVVIDQGRWNVAGDIERKALIHAALMKLEVTAQADGGTKVKMRRPDVSTFSRTLSRFGMYRDEIINLRDILNRGASVANAAIGYTTTTAPVVSTEEEV